MAEQRDPRAIQRDAAHRVLVAFETKVQKVIQAALDRVAEKFAQQALHARKALNADDVTAAEPVDPLDLSKITILWDNEIPTIVTALGAVYDEGMAATFARFGATDTARAQLAEAYLAEAANRLKEVGDSLWDAARQALADGSAEGLGVDELRRKLQETFAENGVELGESRAERIARTATVGAWNRASDDAIHAIPQDERPTYKSWLATIDERTRDAHFRADGQTVPIDQPFIVGGEQLRYPLDPDGSAANTINCRCTPTYGWDPDVPDDSGRQFLSEERIREVIDHFDDRGVTRDIDAAAGDPPHTSGMIALVPSDTDLDRLVIDGYETRDELHMTLWFLGDANNYDQRARQQIIEHATSARHSPVDANGFGAAHWNPQGSDPCWVLNVGDADGDAAINLLRDDIGDVFRGDDPIGPPPATFTPFAPHVCLAYTDDTSLVEEVEQRVGQITFDKIRVAFADNITDIPLSTDETAARESRYTGHAVWQLGPGTTTQGGAPMPDTTADASTHRPWHTPGDTAIAFEDTETGDGRIFARGSLYWEGDSWPLMGNENLDSHDNKALTGSIDEIGRDDRRITASGVLYAGEPIAAKVVQLLEEDAPLGISVDLDDVSFEIRDNTPDADDGEPVMITASAQSVRVTPTRDGRFEITASGVLWGPTLELTIPEQVAASSVITASAGDPDQPGGSVIVEVNSGDELFRVTRARVRGATLVSIPAYSPARIVLNNTSSGIPVLGADQVAASGPLSDLMLEIIDFVAGSPQPVRPGEVASAVGVEAQKARTYLSRAVDAGRLTRVGRGLYHGAPTQLGEVAAAVVGDMDVAIDDDPDREWDGSAAASRVLDWATDDNGDVDADRLARAFLYRDSEANPATVSAYKLGMADIINGELRIVRNAIFATAGGNGVDAADIPPGDAERIRSRICGLYERLAETFPDVDGDRECPWDRDDEDDEVDSSGVPADIAASAWDKFASLPPLPAAWFAEPTETELPDGSGGVHVAEGRVYGWVVQHGVPHDGYAKPLTLATLQQRGDIDFTHFLRRRRELDDGSFVNVGAFTMAVGHHRDGGECETAACQFDDTRTVAGLITVGTNERGMWFSGAAAPWLSQWDREVFATCQPSYRVRQLRDGRYSLRAVLSVPMPGHPSALAASAGNDEHVVDAFAAQVVDRANLALSYMPTITASDVVTAEPTTLTAELGAFEFDYAAMAVAVADEQERRQAVRDEMHALTAEIAELDTTPTTRDAATTTE